MQYQRLRFSKAEVDEAGELLLSGNVTSDQIEWTFEVIGNWRACHAFPLNTMQMALRNRSAAIDGKSLVSQRLKRVPSMATKLTRFPTMKLSQMQDIGGCRAVLSTVDQVYALRNRYVPKYTTHVLVREKDYVVAPKKDGYRSIHLIYRYQSKGSRHYNGRQVEIQIRSRLQHAWATAVETVGVYLRQPIKTGGGEADWRRLFALVSSGFAALEKTPRVPDMPTHRPALLNEIRELSTRLKVGKKLRTLKNAIRETGVQGIKRGYSLVTLEYHPERPTVSVLNFPKAEDREIAMAAYLEAEKKMQKNPIGDVVLVSCESAAALRRAYPSYFLDTDVFLNSANQLFKTRF